MLTSEGDWPSGHACLAGSPMRSFKGFALRLSIVRPRAFNMPGGSRRSFEPDSAASAAHPPLSRTGGHVHGVRCRGGPRGSGKDPSREPCPIAGSVQRIHAGYLPRQMAADTDRTPHCSDVRIRVESARATSIAGIGRPSCNQSSRSGIATDRETSPQATATQLLALGPIAGTACLSAPS